MLSIMRRNLQSIQVFKRTISSSSTFKFDRQLVKEIEALNADISRSKYSCNVSDSYSIGDAPNGGYLMQFAVNSARAHVEKRIPGLNLRDPISLTSYFVNKAVENAPMDIDLNVIGKTKRSLTYSCTFTQEGVIMSHYVGILGDLSSTKKGFTRIASTAPDLPPTSECINASKIIRKISGDQFRCANEVEFHMPSTESFTKTLSSGMLGDTASMKGWVRFSDGRSLSLRSYCFLCDALPPPVLNVCAASWVPTLEYTVHFWSAPPRSTVTEESEQYARFKFESPFVLDGNLYTDGELWSADGSTLLATSRQLAKVLTVSKPILMDNTR